MTRARKQAMVGTFVIAGGFVRCAVCRCMLLGRRALKYRVAGRAEWIYECPVGCDRADEQRKVGAVS